MINMKLVPALPATLNVTQREHQEMLTLVSQCNQTDNPDQICELEWHAGLTKIFGEATLKEMIAAKNVTVVVKYDVHHIPYVTGRVRIKRIEF